VFCGSDGGGGGGGAKYLVVQQCVVLLGGTSLCDVNLHTGCFNTERRLRQMFLQFGCYITQTTSHIPASRVSSCAVHKKLPIY